MSTAEGIPMVPQYQTNAPTKTALVWSAHDAAYKKQQHRVYHSAKHPTYIEFRVDALTQKDGRFQIDGCQGDLEKH